MFSHHHSGTERSARAGHTRLYPGPGAPTPAKSLSIELPSVSLAKLMLTLFSVSILLTSLLLLLTSGYLRNVAVDDLADDHARKIAKLVFHNLSLVMSRGGDHREIEGAISRLGEVINEKNVRVIRGTPVVREFGGVAGAPANRDADPLLRNALDNGVEGIGIGRHRIRYLYPVKVEDRCLGCHTMASVGDINGVIEVFYPVDKLKIPVTLTLWAGTAFTLFFLSVLLVLMYSSLRVLLVRPVVALVNRVKEIILDSDLTRRVDPSGRVIEIEELSKSYNQLLDSIQEYDLLINSINDNDPLTTLYNRAKFEKCVTAEVQNAGLVNGVFSIIFLNIDRFHYINDTRGHPFGDNVLKQVAAGLTSSVRKTDIVCRVGGDEFGIVLPETPLEDAMNMALELCQSVYDMDISYNPEPLQISASLGVVAYPNHGETINQLCVAGDLAIHKAKHAGRNRVAMVNLTEINSAAEVFGRVIWLRRAIQENRVAVFTQPIVDVGTNRVFGHEVLARIRDGDRLHDAGAFIYQLEQESIEELDRFMIEHALANKRDTRSMRGIKLFVNMSAATIQNHLFMRELPVLLERYGVPPDELVIEITEREALQHLSALSRVIQELRDQGILFALDDFGSGFNSFIYLKHFPVDFVKIEGSFVRNAANDERDRLLVKHIHLVTEALGLQTIAEWVEDAAIHQVVRQLGIKLGQGYYYGVPGECATTQNIRTKIA